MHRTTLISLAIAASLTLPLAAHAAVEVAQLGQNTISVEGLLQADGNWYQSDRRDLGDDRMRMRRAEFIVKGDTGGALDWVVGWDAKAEKFLDTNLRARFDHAGLDHSLQLGQFKQPNSLEELTSTRANDFISKATVTNTYAIARRVGLGYGLRGENWSLDASVFGDELTSGLAEGEGFAARATWAPIHGEQRNLHLGINHASHRLAADTLRLRARPNADLADLRLVDTGNLPASDRLASTGLEAMWSDGPLKLQGEYYLARGQRQSGADMDSHGGYASVVYNLGGHAWGYSGSGPSAPKAGGIANGLWQLGLRWDALDLDDGQVRGGNMQALTLGVNYAVGAHARFALNWVKLRSERWDNTAGAVLDDDPTITEARLQLHW